MSQRSIKVRTPRQRSAQSKPQHPSTEREIWQRIDKRGRFSFVTRCTLILGCLLFSLTLLVELFLKRFHASALELSGAGTLCLCIGYVGGSLLWQRGQAILRQPSRRR